MLKILFITHYTALYGANRSLIALAEQLQERNYVVTVLTPEKGDVTKVLSGLGISCITTRFYDEYYYMRGFSRLLGFKRHILNKYFFSSISKLVQSLQPDIIHSNSAALHIGAQLAYQLNIPHIWHIREFGETDYRALHNLGKANHFKWLNRAAALIAISKALKNEVLQAAKAPVQVIYNGVMKQKEMVKIKSKQLLKNKIVFSLVGSFRPEKGHEEALEAFIELAAELPQAELFLPGNHKVAYGAFLKTKVREAGIADRVKFPGFIKDLNEIYSKIDVLLMCSRYEAMGRVTAEAFAYHIPVIAYNGGASAELVEHGKTGFLYQNVEELKNAMLELGRNTRLRQEMGDKAHKNAMQLFTNEQYADQVENVYRLLFAPVK
ncbi:MAG: glycosyltransferase family 4 protein [Bacteroidota bacterium]